MTMRSAFEARDFSLLVAVLVAAVLVGCDKPAEVKPPEPAPPASRPAPPPAPKPAPPPPQPAQPAPPAAAPVAPPPPAPAPPPRFDPPPKPAPAPGGKWELLGERQADLKLDRDRIVVGGRAGGPFRELQITVRGAPLEMHDMVITFGNGQQYKPTLRLHFDERTSSRVIDLPGDRRNIKHVDFVYRTAARREGKAVVTLYGR